MSNTVKVNVSVEKLTKYGYADGNGYVSWSKKLSESDKAIVVPGSNFEAEYYISDTGTRYLNKIFAGQAPKVEAPKPEQKATPAADIERAMKFTPKFTKDKPVDNTMSKDEWAKKDIRISRQGCIQAAVNALGAVLGPETLFVEAEALANKMLAFVNEVK